MKIIFCIILVNLIKSREYVRPRGKKIFKDSHAIGILASLATHYLFDRTSKNSINN